MVISWFSLTYRRRTQRLLGLMVDPFEKVLSRVFTSRERYRRTDISPYFRVNGYPPTDSLEELRGLGDQHQITKHNCIQGWTAVAEWAASRWPGSSRRSTRPPMSRTWSSMRWTTRV